MNIAREYVEGMVMVIECDGMSKIEFDDRRMHIDIWQDRMLSYIFYSTMSCSKYSSTILNIDCFVSK